MPSSFVLLIPQNVLVIALLLFQQKRSLCFNEMVFQSGNEGCLIVNLCRHGVVDEDVDNEDVDNEHRVGFADVFVLVVTVVMGLFGRRRSSDGSVLVF